MWPLEQIKRCRNSLHKHNTRQLTAILFRVVQHYSIDKQRMVESGSFEKWRKYCRSNPKKKLLFVLILTCSPLHIRFRTLCTYYTCTHTLTHTCCHEGFLFVEVFDNNWDELKVYYIIILKWRLFPPATGASAATMLIFILPAAFYLRLVKSVPFRSTQKISVRLPSKWNTLTYNVTSNLLERTVSPLPFWLHVQRCTDIHFILVL